MSSWRPGTLLAASMVNPAAIAGGSADACQKTAAETLSACRSSAQSDYKVALAKCTNLTDPTARESCAADAKVSLSDALQTCVDGNAVRLSTCAKLGGAAYDPVIDPANFSTLIDNPYFPLIPGTTFVYRSKNTALKGKTLFAVTHNTRVIDGVTCVEVHDSVFTDGGADGRYARLVRAGQRR